LAERVDRFCSRLNDDPIAATVVAAIRLAKSGDPARRASDARRPQFVEGRTSLDFLIQGLHAGLEFDNSSHFHRSVELSVRRRASLDKFLAKPG